MNILLDECTPRVVKKRLSHLAIRTVQEMGWSGVKNGVLLKLADQQFDVFITTDKNLRHQQNLSQVLYSYQAIKFRLSWHYSQRLKRLSRQFNLETSLTSRCLERFSLSQNFAN